MSSNDIEKVLKQHPDEWFTITQMKELLGLNRHAILRGFRQLEIRDLVEKKKVFPSLCYYWRIKRISRNL